MNHVTKPLAVAVLLLGAASSASARQGAEMSPYSPPPPGATSTGGRAMPPPPNFAKTRGVLRVRGSEVKTKDAQYPGEPALIGIAPAEMPASLGLKARSKKAEPVDPVELRRRTLALYGDRSDPKTSAHGKSSRGGSGGEDAGSGLATLGWVLGGTAVAAVAGWLIRKRRKQPVTR